MNLKVFYLIDLKSLKYNLHKKIINFKKQKTKASKFVKLINIETNEIKNKSFECNINTLYWNRFKNGIIFN